ncbi:spondin-1 isoform X2 [Cephus cinctus]|uniref:Spondin-1 n=1 Tax=Cephus cinctus TaxID=211228 RepID=A0AAJ7W224_CEPCN|nr:spondin-1 isoform X2 [Cephus cinctus]
MAGHNWPSTVLLLWLATTSANAIKCDRRIDGTIGPKSPVGTKLRIVMMNYNRDEFVTSYMPNTRYFVILKSEVFNFVYSKYTKFLLVAENADETLESGFFDLENQLLAQFSEKCPHAVMETSMIPKEEVALEWVSPPKGNGCIYMRATVMEMPSVWYMDDEGLTMKVCQDSKADADEQGPVLQECCACDEAKYEVTFEGLWSRNTHPKDFPSKGWTTRFSDVIGASHTVDYTFWTYYGIASEGLRQVAEIGSTRKLESELKSQSDHIRTIIKARGISYPNVTGKTFAVFRVDRKHHLMSLVSMISPSPDWIVGVSGLELCLANCSWIQHKELNLYPYDAGTDDGITYMSPDSPTDPPEPIRKITSSFPNDTRSPFYDPSGAEMKPIAKLYLNRQRLYEKTCDEVPSDGGVPEGCQVTSWGPWGACSASCGKGVKLRQRQYCVEIDQVSSKCNMKLTDRRVCHKQPCEHNRYYGGTSTGILKSDMCALTEWSELSPCTTTCGKGTQTRSRNFRHKQHRKKCMAEPNSPELQQTFQCDNPKCTDTDSEEVRETDDTTEGTEENEDEDEDAGENADEEASNYQDYEEHNGKVYRAAKLTRDAEVENIEEWQQKCPSSKFTEWSLWSPCSTSCGPGKKIRSRRPLSEFKNWSSPYNENDEFAYRHDCKIEEALCTPPITSCDFTNEEAEQICSEPMDKGDCDGRVLRFYFDKPSITCKTFHYTSCGGNRNNFATVEDCNRTCINYQRDLRANLSAIMKNFKVSVSSVLSYHIPVQEQRSVKTKREKSGSKETTENLLNNGIEISSQILDTAEANDGRKVNCKVSDWSEWTECQGCTGYRNRTREILVKNQNGGKRCPKKLIQKNKCRNLQQCESVDCVMTSWSNWSRCAATCGESVQYRCRRIKIFPRGPYGKLCPHVVESQQCHLPPCPLYYHSSNDALRNTTYDNAIYPEQR